jgi:hypothetical protein
LKASDIAKKASELVSGERDRQHGDKAKNFENIALMWNAYIDLAGKRMGRQLDARDVGNMMALMKMARQFSGDLNLDDFIDGCGYLACAGEIASLQDEAQSRISRVA